MYDENDVQYLDCINNVAHGNCNWTYQRHLKRSYRRYYYLLRNIVARFRRVPKGSEGFLIILNISLSWPLSPPSGQCRHRTVTPAVHQLTLPSRQHGAVCTENHQVYFLTGFLGLMSWKKGRTISFDRSNRQINRSINQSIQRRLTWLSQFFQHHAGRTFRGLLREFRLGGKRLGCSPVAGLHRS